MNAIKRLTVLSFVVLFIGAAVGGCTTPRYTKMIIEKYDAEGKLIGTEIRQSIAQTDPSASPMKVKITNRSKLEE